MSGPKYYDFTVGSAEEASAVRAELSALHGGVSVWVEGNQLKFKVPEDVWARGVNQSSIQAEINAAKARNAEKQRAFVEEKKKTEAETLKNKRESINAQYTSEKNKIAAAKAECSKIKDFASKSYQTPFGKYDLSSEYSKIKAVESQVVSESSALDRKRADSLSACESARAAIGSCTTMSELSSVKNKISSIYIGSSSIDGVVASLSEKISEKSKRLQNFISFLDGLYEGMKQKDLLGYLERVKGEIALIDVFDADAYTKIQNVLAHIETEIALLKEQGKLSRESKEISEKVDTQIKFLNDLSDKLRPVLESINVENTASANYEKLSKDIIKQVDEKLLNLSSLEFVHGKNQAKIGVIKERIIPLRSSLTSEATLSALQKILVEIQNLEKECVKDNEVYKRFKEELDKYESYYVELQGALSAKGSSFEDDCDEDEDEDGFLVSPTEFFLSQANGEEQIEELKQKNGELEKIVNACRQEFNFAAVCASVSKGEFGSEFKKTRTKDGSLNLAYVRKSSEGVIFDVQCQSDGRIGIFPRGVVLCNGKKMIEENDLKSFHSSCSWAEEIHSAFTSFGLTNSGSYEEMSQEIVNSMYSEENYYHITSREESERYLKLLGFSKDKINAVLGSETDEREYGYTEDYEEDTRSVSSARYVDDK